MFAYAEKKYDKASEGDVRKRERVAQTVKQNLTGIPDTAKTHFENLSGFSFDDVRVHYSSDKPAKLQAYAYTQGNQVYVAPGQEMHLPHELGHVMQQKSGKVSPTMTLDGTPINDDIRLEKEADALGAAAMRKAFPAPVETPRILSEGKGCETVQRDEVKAVISGMTPGFVMNHLITDEQKGRSIGERYRDRDRVSITTVIFRTEAELRALFKSVIADATTFKYSGGRNGFWFVLDCPAFTFYEKPVRKSSGGGYTNELYNIKVQEWRGRSLVTLEGECETRTGRNCVIDHVAGSKRA